MARSSHPRRNDAHKIVAAEVLRRHAAQAGKPIELPVPIELIVEITYQLTIDVDGGDGLVCALGIDVVDDDARSSARQADRAAATESGAGASDYRDESAGVRHLGERVVWFDPIGLTGASPPT